MKGEEIIYSLNVTDVQTVSKRLLKRSLTNKEVALVRDSVGDFIDWFHAIEYAISRYVPDEEPQH